MRHQKRKRKGEGLIGGIGAMAGTLLVGLALLPLVASTGVGGGLDGWATDDEGGGSLPSSMDVPTTPGFGKTLLDCRPSFYVQGPEGLILEVAGNAEGDRYFERLHNPEGELELVRVVFCGDVHLQLDGAIFYHPDVTAGLAVGWALGDSLAAIVYQDRIFQKTTMPANSVFPVPFAAMQDAGILGDGLYFFSANVQGQRNLISVGTYGGTVEIDQREVQG